MSEMLGNQYFIARRYLDACSEFENESVKNPTNYSVKKKLIICYLQTNRFEQAFKNFFELTCSNITAITNTDVSKDDCPCPEIIERILPGIFYTTDDEQFIKLGMLYLYCDIKESLKYFEMVSQSSELYEKVRKIISIEKTQLTNLN